MIYFNKVFLFKNTCLFYIQFIKICINLLKILNTIVILLKNVSTKEHDSPQTLFYRKFYNNWIIFITKNSKTKSKQAELILITTKHCLNII